MPTTGPDITGAGSVLCGHRAVPAADDPADRSPERNGIGHRCGRYADVDLDGYSELVIADGSTED